MPFLDWGTRGSPCRPCAPGIGAPRGRPEVCAEVLFFDREGDGIPVHPYAVPNGAFSSHGWPFTSGMIDHLDGVFGIRIGSEPGQDVSHLLVRGRPHSPGGDRRSPLASEDETGNRSVFFRS